MQIRNSLFLIASLILSLRSLVEGSSSLSRKTRPIDLIPSSLRMLPGMM